MFVECMPLFCSHNRRKAIVFDTEGLVIMSEHALISSNEINASLLGILCRCMDLAVYAMIILQRATMFNICENLHNQLHKYHTQMFWKFAKVRWCEKEKKQKAFQTSLRGIVALNYFWISCLQWRHYQNLLQHWIIKQYCCLNQKR